MAALIAPRTRGRVRRGSAALLALLALVFGGLVVALKARTDAVPRFEVPGGSIMYVPSGKFLRYAAFGFDTLAADLVYLWAIQYFGETGIPDRYAHVEHVFGIIADLDPRYVDAYDVGALIAAQEKGDVPLALRILDKGLERNPGEWFFPFQAGHIAQMMLKDWELARGYYAKVMAIPGAPEIAKRLYANAAFRGMDYRTSWETWQEVYRTSDDPRVRKFASNHLYRIKAVLDIRALEEALAAYQERYGHRPADLDALARAGIIREVPKDMDGADYIYDSVSGKIEAPTVPWKR